MVQNCRMEVRRNKAATRRATLAGIAAAMLVPGRLAAQTRLRPMS
jgi:hypothetical protein